MTTTRKTNTSLTSHTVVPEDLGKFIARDAAMVEEIVWELFEVTQQGRYEFASLGGVHHLARHLLH